MDCAISKRDIGSRLALGRQAAQQADWPKNHAGGHWAAYMVNPGAIRYPGCCPFEGTEDNRISKRLDLPDVPGCCDYTDGIAELPVGSSAPDDFHVLMAHSHDSSLSSRRISAASEAAVQADKRIPSFMAVRRRLAGPPPTMVPVAPNGHPRKSQRSLAMSDGMSP